METKSFDLSVKVTAIPHNKETASYFFGEKSKYDSTIPENFRAIEILDELVKDAITHNMMMRLKFVSKNGDPDENRNSYSNDDLYYWDLLNSKIQTYESIRNSISGT